VFQTKLEALAKLRTSVRETSVDGKPLAAVMKMQNFDLNDLPPNVRQLASPEIWKLIETDLKYEGYVQRQSLQNAKLHRDRGRLIPPDLDYDAISGLRRETRQKLSSLRPISLGHAAQVSGITPADISIISIWLQKKKQMEPAAS
jgi:tRNA uridine 5-carboxymethylaminomethyl modification enzyme